MGHNQNLPEQNTKMARPQAAAVASRCEGQRGKSCRQRPDDDRDRQRNICYNIALISSISRFFFMSHGYV